MISGYFKKAFERLVLQLIFYVMSGQLLAQTGEVIKYMYPLPNPTSQDKISPNPQGASEANLEIMLDATHWGVVPPNTVIAKSFIAKVINSQGVSAADITTPIYYKNDDIPDRFNDSVIIRGRTRTVDNIVVDLEPEEISEVKTSENYRQKIFSLPAVETGAIIQYEYEIIDRFNVQYSKMFELLNTFPTMLARYFIVTPLKWDVAFDAFPATITLPPAGRVPTGGYGTQEAFVWEIRDALEFESEDYMPSSFAIAPRLYFGAWAIAEADFDYRNNWNGYGSKIIWETVKSKIKGDSNLNSKIEELVKNNTEWRKKSEAIYYYLQNDFQVSSIQSLPSQTAAETAKEKSGNSADLAVLFYYMLKETKTDAFFALIRNRSHGDFPRKVPMIDWFDKMIVMLTNGTDTLWVDPSSRTSKFGTLPVEDQGVDALVIAGNDTRFIKTPQIAKDINHQSKTYFARIAEDGTLSASCLINNSGEYDRIERDDYKNLYDKEIREDIRSQIVSYYPSAVLKNYHVSDVKDYTTNFTVSFDFEVPRFFTQADTSNLLYFEPFLLTESRLLPALPVRSRKYPIKFSFGDQITTTVTWEIPASLQTVSLPPALDMRKPFADYISKFEVKNNKIIAERKLHLITDTIEQKDFDAFREFSKSVRANGNSKVILRRKK